jgi:Domain of unknown function (DUF1877)
MGMIGNYRRITIDRLAKLQNELDSIADFLLSHNDPEFSSEKYLDIDKSWHGIHFLLTGDRVEGKPPLENAILGGSPLGDPEHPQLDYGVRFLIPNEVQEVAKALSQMAESELRSRFNPELLSAANIYPNVWERGAEELDYLMFYYVRLVKFFQAAAENNEAMLIYIT